MELSTVINNLLPKAQLITPQSWTDIAPPTQTCLVAANERKVFLDNQELEQLKQQQLIDQSQYDLLIQLREQAPQLIDRARQDLLQEFPVLTQPGGGLYPATREKACWLDLWHFLRCISYAIVVKNLNLQILKVLNICANCIK
ncbi:MAG: hypothetical protein HC796_05350 [Synechococcaceae cyanobacterium RL_1_2]|nr:hypothetical protein [Synechococcaceae cyanobacterium RL_1_2]